MVYKQNQSDIFSSILWLIGLLVTGYFLYTTFLLSDRSIVRACLIEQIESHSVGVGDIRLELQHLEQAGTVEIFDEERYALAGRKLVHYNYHADGRKWFAQCRA